ncbi:UNVERIFIED_CONTAM: hypothetical protein K2H54_056298 [Gekko kuhli]
MFTVARIQGAMHEHFSDLRAVCGCTRRCAQAAFISFKNSLNQIPKQLFKFKSSEGHVWGHQLMSFSGKIRATLCVSKHETVCSLLGTNQFCPFLTSHLSSKCP